MPSDELLTNTEERMRKAGESLARELAGIRTGKANPNLLDPIKVDYYGTPTPLKQLANVSAPEPRLMVIQPFDRNAIGEIEKAVQKSSLGLNPSNDGNVVRIPIPPLTEERRKELSKVVRKMGEASKVSVRNIRRDANNDLKKLEKDGTLREDESVRDQEKVQKLTDKYVEEIERLVTRKEEEVMEV